MDEKNLFLKTVEEKYRRFCDYYSFVHSDFLSPEQQSQLSGFLRTHEKEGVYLFGGYAEAERQQVVFLPDYSTIPAKLSALAPFEDEAEKSKALARLLLDYFEQNPEDCPLILLEIRIPPTERRALGHRDYLGALLGAGIRREKLGDILVSEEGAQLVVARELADYLTENLRQVGAVSINAKKSPIFALKNIKSERKSLKFTVPSPRIDNITASCFGISRAAAAEAVSRGRVFVNGCQISKPDLSLKGGEKIVLRGSGKAIYKGCTGTSKKGRLCVEMEKYV